jgi:hypothetical protein
MHCKAMLVKYRRMFAQLVTTRQTLQVPLGGRSVAVIDREHNTKCFHSEYETPF